MNKAYLFLLIFMMIIQTQKLLSFENKILFKVNNEIISSIDVYNEINYLTALNPDFSSIDQNEKYEIALNSLEREKIKKIEIIRNTDNLKIDDEFLDNLIESVYKQLKFKNLNDFKKHLSSYQTDYNLFKDKIIIENIWNELIYIKFKDKVIINKEELTKRILNSNKEFSISLKLSEITFRVENTEDFDEKYNSIKKDIFDKGFENAAIIHSISNTSKVGGKIGWVIENSIENKIKKQLLKLNVGDFSEPFVIPGGFVILKIDDKKKENLLENNLEKKLEELIKTETNRQLQNFSNIYLQKIKKNIVINAL
jgi:peptidyl-prolyl cis-trans isomerase SurA